MLATVSSERILASKLVSKDPQKSPKIVGALPRGTKYTLHVERFVGVGHDVSESGSAGEPVRERGIDQAGIAESSKRVRVRGWSAECEVQAG